MTGLADHALDIVLSDQHLDVRVVCPHDDADMTTWTFEQLPECRKAPYDEGTPYEPCNVRTWATELGIESLGLDGPDRQIEISSVPVPVTYRWSGGDEADFYLLPSPCSSCGGRTARFGDPLVLCSDDCPDRVAAAAAAVVQAMGGVV